jgi:hypothetical protein
LFPSIVRKGNSLFSFIGLSYFTTALPSVLECLSACPKEFGLIRVISLGRICDITQVSGPISMHVAIKALTYLIFGFRVFVLHGVRGEFSEGDER